MPSAGATDAHRIVIAGGGVAAAELALGLDALARGHVTIEIVAPNSELVYRPLAVAEPFGLTHSNRLPLSELADAASAHVVQGSVASVDPSNQALTLADGHVVTYDALVVAVGARPRVGVRGATTFTSEATTQVREIIEGLADGTRVAFAIPAGITWPLPLYELALMTSTWSAARELDVHLEIVTAEREPLEVFGARVSAVVAELLGERGIGLTCGRAPSHFDGGELALVGHGHRSADSVIAGPVLTGPALQGLPHDRAGFLPVDHSGAVRGTTNVYAAGDCTSYPLKQGGLAIQQGAATARAIARICGVDIADENHQVELDAILLTGGPPLYLHRDPDREPGFDASEASFEPRWWPATKISGGYLAVHSARAAAATPPEPGLTWLRLETDDLAPYLAP
jgi:sulfide:quinone oxidoreductase